MASGTGTGVTSGTDLQVTEFKNVPHFTAVWTYSAASGTYTDRTIAAQKTTDAAFTAFSAAGDYLYLGSDRRFDLAGFYLGTVGSTGALTYEYARVSDWEEFVPTFEYDFTVNGAFGAEQLTGWTALAFSNTSPHSATPPDTTARYWVRISAASVTTAPTISYIEMRPYTAYCTPTQVANLLQLKNDFTELTIPTLATVEDAIHAAESHIDFRTKKSWRLNYVENEEHDFNISGNKLVHRYPRAITKMEVWNGSEYQTLTEGRTHDYFLVPNLGMVEFARYFMLPARFVGYNAPLWRWGWGEFTFGVRISYFHGSDIASNPYEGAAIFDICRKMVAMDLVNTYDFSVLTVSGMDKVPLANKITNWQVEIDEKLDTLRGWETF